MQNNHSTVHPISPNPIPKNDLKPIINGFSILDNEYGELNASHLYYACFNELPNKKIVSANINYEKCIKWLDTSLADRTLKKFNKETYKDDCKKSKIDYRTYILEEQLIVTVEVFNMVEILYSPQQEPQANELLAGILKFKKRDTNTTTISLITSDGSHWKLSDIKIKKPKLNIALHYNDDLAPVHHTILKSIKGKNKNGLVLLYGEPGTGKSTYLRYLIHSQKKRVLFLSPGLAGNLDSPEFTDLLLENRDTLIVIEDAEELLLSRHTNTNSSISTLLNMTDGLLGESLGIQFICTFNTQLANIDKALLRKGRLIALYEFKPLTTSKSLALLRHLKVTDHTPTAPMSLAQIFHIQEEQYNFKATNRNRIGF